MGVSGDEVTAESEPPVAEAEAAAETGAGVLWPSDPFGQGVSHTINVPLKLEHTGTQIGTHAHPPLVV